MTTGDAQNFNLKWDSFQSTVTSALDTLRERQEFVDVTLCCRGDRVTAHRIILSACSPYFRDVLNSTQQCQHLVLFINEMCPADLRALVEFMYRGHVNVAESQLPSFLRTAEMLQIRGLYGSSAGSTGAGNGAGGDDNSTLNICSVSGGGDLLSGDSVAAMADVSFTETDCDQHSHQQHGHRTSQQQQQQQQQHSQHRRSAIFSSSRQTQRGQQQQQQYGSSVHVHGDGSLASTAVPAAADCADSAVNNADEEQIKLELTDDDIALSARAEINLGDILNSSDHPAAGGGCVSDLFSGAGDEESTCNEAVGLSPHVHLAQFDAPSVSAHSSPAMMGTALTSTSYRTTRTPSHSRHSLARILCAVCGKAYANRGSLKMHMKTHQGMTKCGECGRVFSMVHHLRLHLRRVHRFTDQQVRLVVPTRVRFKS